MLGISCPQAGARLHVLLCAHALHISGVSSLPSPVLVLSATPCDSCRRKRGESNLCQGQSMPEEELHADPRSTLRGNGNKAANVPSCPSCQAQELPSPASLSKQTPHSRAQSTVPQGPAGPNRTHGHLHLGSWEKQPLFLGSVHAKPHATGS